MVETDTITADELSHGWQKSRKPEIIDVRSESEYAAAHIPGAKCVPLQQLSSRLDDLGDGDLVLVCEGGTRACLAQKQLIGHRQRLLVLQGGMRAWRNAGLPVVAPLGTCWSLERQVRLGAGVLILAGVLLTVLVDPRWILLAGFAGAGLTFAGATDICLMGKLLARMPWNQVKLKPGSNR